MKALIYARGLGCVIRECKIGARATAAAVDVWAEDLAITLHFPAEAVAYLEVPSVSHSKQKSEKCSQASRELRAKSL